MEVEIYRVPLGRTREGSERVTIKWNHLIDKDSPKIKELDQVRIDKAEEIFPDMF